MMDTILDAVDTSLPIKNCRLHYGQLRSALLSDNKTSLKTQKIVTVLILWPYSGRTVELIYNRYWSLSMLQKCCFSRLNEYLSFKLHFFSNKNCQNADISTIPRRQICFNQTINFDCAGYDLHWVQFDLTCERWNDVGE